MTLDFLNQANDYSYEFGDWCGAQFADERRHKVSKWSN